MNEQTKALLKLATAYAMGCQTTIAQYVDMAKQEGVSGKDLEEVTQLVRQVRLTAMMDADHAMEDALAQEAVAVGSSCGCGSGKCC